MADIDIGAGASNYGGFGYGANVTHIDRNNLANASGTLTSFELYFSDSNSAVCKVGTFYGSSLSWNDRDFESIGKVNGGSTQTFTGKDCAVGTGDALGILYDTGDVSQGGSGGSGWVYKAGDYFSSSTNTYTQASASAKLGMYATGATPVAAPTVTTQAASSVTATTCTGNGDITAGDQPITERGVCYKSGAGETPTTADTVVHDHTDATGAFTMSVTGLSAGTQYSMRAYAINSAGTAYGSVVTVSTLGTVTTQAGSNVVWCGLTGNGNVTNTGVSALTAKGMCYKTGTTGDPTIADSKHNTTGSSTGAFTVTVGPLVASTDYRVRAYATNTEGTFYGDTVQETTPAAGEQGGETLTDIFGIVG